MYIYTYICIYSSLLCVMQFGSLAKAPWQHGLKPLNPNPFDAEISETPRSHETPKP